MKVTYRINDKLTFELETEDQKKLFEDLASLEEIFGLGKCGKCGKSDYKFVVRQDKEDNKYYELRCHSKDAVFFKMVWS